MRKVTMEGVIGLLQSWKPLALLLCVLAFHAPAQSPPAGFPVHLDGKTVITVRWGYANFTAAVRADGISKRLKTIADDPSIPLQLTMQPSELSINIQSGDTVLASVFDGDARLEGTTKEELAKTWSASFLAALQAYRAAYGWRQIATRVALALLTIAFCIWLLLLIRRYTKRVALNASAVLERRVKGTQSPVGRLVSDAVLRSLVMRVFALVRLALLLIVVALSIHILLGIFPQTRPLATEIYQGVAAPVRAFGHAVWLDLPAILFILLLALVTWYVIRLVRYFFQKVGEGAVSLEGFRPSWASVTERLVSIALVVLAILVAYPYIPGSQSPAFKGVSIFLGVLVSLGSTGLVANLVTGIMLTYMDAFEVGDLVEIGEITAYVKSTSLLTTRFITRKNEVITIPNSYIMSKHITNYSARTGRDGILISTTVGIGYDSPWRQIEAILLIAASRTQSVQEEPAPFVLLLSLNSYDVTYEVNAYLKPSVRRYVGLAELNRNVLDAFNEYGVQIMTPSYVADTADAKVVAKENWHAAPADPQQSPVPPQRDFPPARS
jgi:small-conductance mechanosensitive channel